MTLSRNFKRVSHAGKRRVQSGVSQESLEEMPQGRGGVTLPRLSFLERAMPAPEPSPPPKPSVGHAPRASAAPPPEPPPDRNREALRRAFRAFRRSGVFT